MRVTFVRFSVSHGLFCPDFTAEEDMVLTRCSGWDRA